MKLAEIELDRVYEFKGGDHRITPVRTLEKTQQKVRTPAGGWHKYWAFKICFDADAWIYPDPCPPNIYMVRPNQLRRLWVPPPPPQQTIPVSPDDVALLARLAFRWDLSPQEALHLALRRAVAQER